MAMALAGAGAAPRRQYRLGQNSEINVTPFVDIMLVLLIIFMVTAPLATTTIRLDLPPLNPHQASPQSPVMISLTEDGRIFASGPGGEQLVTLETLAGGIDRALGGAPAARQEILVRADQRLRYGAFMAVMNRLQEDGYYKVALVGEEVH